MQASHLRGSNVRFCQGMSYRSNHNPRHGVLEHADEKTVLTGALEAEQEPTYTTCSRAKYLVVPLKCQL
jgi:hypothetical protein